MDHYLPTSCSHQEDFHAFATLSLNPEELRLSLKKLHRVDWDPALVGEPLSNQVLFVGLYDGSVGILNPFLMTLMVFDLCRHGGSAVSQYLRQELHGLFESVDKSSIPELFHWIMELGGYFKRFKGGPLAPWVKEGGSQEMDLEARATLAFFEVSNGFHISPKITLKSHPGRQKSLLS